MYIIVYVPHVHTALQARALPNCGCSSKALQFLLFLYCPTVAGKAPSAARQMTDEPSSSGRAAAGGSAAGNSSGGGGSSKQRRLRARKSGDDSALAASRALPGAPGYIPPLEVVLRIKEETMKAVDEAMASEAIQKRIQTRLIEERAKLEEKVCRICKAPKGFSGGC